MISPPSFCTANQLGTPFCAHMLGEKYFMSLDSVMAKLSVGTQIDGAAFSTLVLTFIPSATAAESTYGLNDEPTCSRA